MFPGLLILLEVLASFYRSFCSGPAQIATEMQGGRVARGNGVSGYLKKRSCGAPDLEFPKKAADEPLPTDGALHGLLSAPALFSEPRPPAFLLRAGVSPVGTPPSLGTNSFPVKSQVFNHVRLLVSRIRQGGHDVLETHCFQVMNSCQSATMISE